VTLTKKLQSTDVHDTDASRPTGRPAWSGHWRPWTVHEVPWLQAMKGWRSCRVPCQTWPRRAWMKSPVLAPGHRSFCLD